MRQFFICVYIFRAINKYKFYLFSVVDYFPKQTVSVCDPLTSVWQGEDGEVALDGVNGEQVTSLFLSSASFTFPCTIVK